MSYKNLDLLTEIRLTFKTMLEDLHVLNLPIYFLSYPSLAKSSNLNNFRIKGTVLPFACTFSFFDNLIFYKSQ